MITLQAQHLARFYGRAHTLHDISFCIEGAGVTGLLGRNGAGKSTLLRLLAGADLPTRGEVRSGTLTSSQHPLEWRSHVGFLPERPALYADETPQSMLLHHLGLHGIFGKQARLATDEFISRCQLKEVQHQRIAELSFGYRKRTGLAITLSHRPRIVLLDEPGAGLDPAQLIALRASIQDIATDHLIILSSHLLQEIALITPHMLVLHAGHLITHTREATQAHPLLDDTRTLCAITIPAHQRDDASAAVQNSQGTELLRHTPQGDRHTLHVLIDEDQRNQVMRALLDAGIDLLAWHTLDAQDDLEARFMAWTSPHMKEEE